MIEFLDGLKKSKSKKDWWDQLSESQQRQLQIVLGEINGDKTVSTTEFWNELKNNG